MSEGKYEKLEEDYEVPSCVITNSYSPYWETFNAPYGPDVNGTIEDPNVSGAAKRKLKRK